MSLSGKYFRNIVFAVFLFSFSENFSQSEIHFSNGLDSVLAKNREYKEVTTFMGKASRIKKRNVDQMFCGVTRGRDIEFIYKNLDIKLNGRKRLGYVQPEEIGKGMAYYDNCSISSICISSKSRIKINGTIKLNQLDTNTVKKYFGEPAEKDFDDSDLYIFEKYELTDDVQARIAFLKGLIVYNYNSGESDLNFYFSPGGRLVFIMID